jgi:ribulose-5-phosphate 4-epimerase/fuculose-1-phosphate aldolase
MNGRAEDIDDLRRRIAEACRVLGHLEITASTYGHASARLPGTNRIFIRARGPAESGVRYTTPEDVIEVDLDGRRIGGSADGYSAPVEVHIHTELYKSRPEVNAVIHAHPSAVVLLTVCRKPLLPIYGSYDPLSLALALDGVPTFEKSILIRRPELGRDLAAFMGQAKACMMRGHGITTAANSVEEAALVAIQLNTIATMNYQAGLLGEPHALPPEEQDEFRELLAEAGAGSASPTPGTPSSQAKTLWRYYARVTEESQRA